MHKKFKILLLFFLYRYENIDFKPTKEKKATQNSQNNYNLLKLKVNNKELMNKT